MADDSWDIDVNLDFHPCDRPHGMKDYVLSDLTPEQQTKLNERKREQIRMDQKYMRAHPEIRGLIVMILRILMRKRPKYDNIYETIGLYFTKSSIDIQEEVYDYLKEREKILSTTSFISVKEESGGSSASIAEPVEEEEIEEEEEEIIEKIIEEIVKIPSATVIETPESVGSVEKIVAEVLEEILELVNEEIDLPSLEDITNVGLLDYDDHAFGSNESISSSESSSDDN